MQVIDSTPHLINWVWSPSHQGIPGNEQPDRLAERGPCMHPFYLIAAPPRQWQACHRAQTRKPATCRVLLLDEEDVPYLQTPLFATPSTVTVSPDTQSHNGPRYVTDHESTPVASKPSHIVTPLPMVARKLLGLEPM